MRHTVGGSRGNFVQHRKPEKRSGAGVQGRSCGVGSNPAIVKAGEPWHVAVCKTVLTAGKVLCVSKAAVPSSTVKQRRRGRP